MCNGIILYISGQWYLEVFSDNALFLHAQMSLTMDATYYSPALFSTKQGFLCISLR